MGGREILEELCHGDNKRIGDFAMLGLQVHHQASQIIIQEEEEEIEQLRIDEANVGSDFVI